MLNLIYVASLKPPIFLGQPAFSTKSRIHNIYIYACNLHIIYIYLSGLECFGWVLTPQCARLVNTEASFPAFDAYIYIYNIYMHMIYIYIYTHMPMFSATNLEEPLGARSAC